MFSLGVAIVLAEFFLDGRRVLIIMSVDCRAVCNFYQIFWLGLGCVGHSYLDLAVFLVPFHAVTLINFPFPVIISDR